MKTKIATLLALVAASIAGASDKPTVYNPTTEEHVDRGRQLAELFSPKFIVVDIRDDTDYVPPKPVAGGLPYTALSKSGESLSGYVLVAYIITPEGRATEPHIMKTTDERLNSVAINAMNDWRFVAAKLKNSPLPTTAVQEFNFIAGNRSSLPR